MSCVPPPPVTTPAAHDDSRPDTLASLARFETSTTAPSPPPSCMAGLQSHDGAATKTPSAHHIPTAALRISTELPPSILSTTPVLARRGSVGGPFSHSSRRGLAHKTSSSSLQPMSRTPSFKSAVANSIGSAGSAIPSPIIAAMGDMTPLPSPLLPEDSPGPWKRLSSGSASPPPPPPLQTRPRLASMSRVSALVTNNGESIESAAVSASKRKMYAALDAASGALSSASHLPSSSHPPQQGRNRSISEYIPDPLAAPKRHVTVSGSHVKADAAQNQETQMRRELNFSESRGLTRTMTQPPTPPPSESSRDSADGSKSKDHGCEYFEACGRGDEKKRRWRCIGFLGQGTFSRVMLATSQMVPDNDFGEPSAGPTTPVTECNVNRRKLVAVKVCEHGPRGGASEERVEMSLKRELELMQSIHHPSIVNLRAWSIEPTRAILVLSYSPGGDLFEVATANPKILTPAVMRRMFAELVGAVSYLHDKRIVHRDIKLENVLVNLCSAELTDPATDWTSFPHSVVTLTDLGLSRRISDDEKLETRCGSDDYAAPEVILGQPYDGRATDAWSLGVLLYALIEGRLPFDPMPGTSDGHRMRSRTSHRIARVEWRWFRYAGDDGEHEGDAAKFEAQGLRGAMDIAEGLLKRARSRWGVDKVAAQPWVRDAILVDGGLQFWEEEEAEEV